MGADLNEPQRRAVMHGTGPLLILAGAGSGKTRVLTHRIAELVNGRDVLPHRILAITFTNKAARELKERLVDLLGDMNCKGMWVGTFHSVSHRILRMEAKHAGLRSDFVIADADDQKRICKEIIKRRDLRSDVFSPTRVVAAISRAKDELKTPDDMIARHDSSDPYHRELGSIYADYQKELNRNGMVDFGDLVAMVVRLFMNNQQVLDRYAGFFEHVLIDEYQDTNHSQYVLAGLLASTHQNLVVVGDDDQSIYGWRGADIRNILGFEREFPGAKTIVLDVNYRSTYEVLELANHVISKNKNRKPKSLVSSRGHGDAVTLYTAVNAHDEAEYIVSQIESLRAREGLKLRDIAVLYRSHAQSRVVEQKLVAHHIPYQLVGGPRFFERREVKDLVAYLRVLVNSVDDVSLKRIANVPRRGIGQRTLDEWEHHAGRAGLSMQQFLEYLDGVSSGARTRLSSLATLLERLKRLAGNSVQDALNAVLEHTRYLDMLDNDEDADQRKENVNELLSMALEYDTKQSDEGIGGFLAEVALFTDIDSYDDADEVTLLTIHAAKGLEFPAVFLIGLDEGLLPHYMSLHEEPERLEEERRLCYVAMTRAMDRLFLCRSEERVINGKVVPCASSQFLDDIPGHMLVQSGCSRDTTVVGASYSPTTIARKRRRMQDTHKVENLPKQGESQFSDGDKVIHPSFGEGTVINCTGTGDDEVATVAFKGEAGLKKIMVKYGGMRRV